MGCHYSVTCLDCETDYDCGYGSYSSWAPWVDTVVEFDAWATKEPDLAAISKNQNIRKVLVEHVGHKLERWSSDYCSEIGGDLLMHAGYDDVVLVKKFGSFARVDMDKL